MAMISVLTKKPGEIPRHVNVSDSLEALQKYVGGYIEVVTLMEDVVVICNEEGRLKGLPYCATICGHDFVGDIIMAGADGCELADLPISWKELKVLFPALWAKPKKRSATK